MKLTIYDIAKLSKVSIATVSRAMNPETKHLVSKKTLKRIEEVVRQHHYKPNIAAKGLSSARFNTIGVILPQLEGIFFSDYYSKILSGVSDYLLNSPYAFKIIIKKLGEMHQDTDFRYGEGVDALILTHWPLFFEDKGIFEKINVPCCIINDFMEGIHAHSVYFDSYEGGRLAGQCLVDHGHERVGVLAGSKYSTDSKDRVNGFKEVYRERGLHLSESDIVSLDFEFQKAYEWALESKEYLSKKSALFCANDRMALGVLKALKELGLRCPEDLSIIGYDDEREASFSSPSLTTIHQDIYQSAFEGVKLLTERVYAKESESGFLKVIKPVSLILRNSVRKI